jgi:hypothetical protein
MPALDSTKRQNGHLSPGGAASTNSAWTGRNRPPHRTTRQTRSGVRRIIPPCEYRHLRAWAGVRIASGIVLAGLGAVTLSFGGNDWKTYGWTMVFLALAAAQFSFAHWELTIAESART